MVCYNISLENQIEDYLRQVNKHHLEGEHLEHDDRGFISYSFVGEVMIIPDLYGDGKYWLKRAIEIAKENGMKRLRGGTTRNIKAYCKMFGLKVVGYIVEREV